MPVSVVVGGQYGSEGKGKVSYWLAKQRHAAVAIRVGGPNSGHTAVDDSGKTHVFRQLPTPVLDERIIGALAAGSYLDLGVLLAEISSLGLTPERLWIDRHAMIIENRDKLEEREIAISIGSTASGTGSAVGRRIKRQGQVMFAESVDELAPFVRDTIWELRNVLNCGGRAIIEGTQGFGLSLTHCIEYPYATSRDTTAAAFVSECGLSPLDVDEVCVVLRTYPIRVAGDSGPLPNEISWEEIARRLGRKHILREYTSVTRKLRRVADFDPYVVQKAICANNPTILVLNHLDYIKDSEQERFVRFVESSISRSVDVVGLGPADLRELRTAVKAI